MKTITILAGSEWRGVHYCIDTDFSVSDAYADYLVNILKIAKYK